MKALVLADYSRFDFTDVPEPVVGPRDVLIRVRACGICGSDIHGMDGSTGRRIPPIVMGHEAAGIVERVGTDVTRWKEGDRVTFDSTIYCGVCETCQSGPVNLCPNRRVIGVSTPEYRQNGAFAEYIAVPDHVVYALPGGVSFVAGAVVEPLSVAAHALSRAPVAPASSAVVVGAGVIGLMTLQALRARGCRNVSVVDVAPERLTLAARLGASAVVRSDRDDPLEAIRSASSADGADLVFEAVGITPTVRLAVSAARKGGTVVLIGNVAASVELPLQTVVTRQLTLAGTAASAGEYPDAIAMIRDGRVDAEALVSEVRPLSDGQEWFDRLHRGDPRLVKVVLEP
jgi:L-iditol 2-dehydrogenase